MLNGNIYFGSTKNFFDRYRRHKNGLLSGKHSNERLQADYNAQGGEGFTYYVLLYTDTREEAIVIETRFFGYFCGKEWCYNIAVQQDVTFRGRKHTPETKAKISEAKKRHHGSS